MYSSYDQIDYSRMPLRHILCVDVKSSFASIEAVRRGIDPLKAYIIVVSALNRPGAVVLASSPLVKEEYKIKTGNRKFEIPNDPKLMIVPPSMGLYIKQNRLINKIFSRFAVSEDILTYSIDESFLDVTATTNLFGDPMKIANKIKLEVLSELGLPVTIGIGDNPLLAKLALDNAAKHHNDQIAYWGYDTIPDTIWRIPNLSDVWGISNGWVQRFNRLGINTVYDLAHANPNLLEKEFGIIGLQQYFHANGVDYSRISERVKTKNHSYSKGQILMKDYISREDIIIILHEMVDEISARLRRHHRACDGIALGIGGSKNHSEASFGASRKLSRATNITAELIAAFDQLFFDNWRGYPVRQVYVSCNLAKVAGGNLQMDLFEEAPNERLQRLDQALDAIHERFGKTAIFRGTGLLPSSTYLTRAGYVGGHQGYSEVNDDMA